MMTTLMTDTSNTPTIYKIEIHLCPTKAIDSSTPFFWSLKSRLPHKDSDWRVEQVGWAETRELAWNHVYTLYSQCKR